MDSIQLPLPFVEWRDIPGYEGYYEVSNTGVVRLGINKRNQHAITPSFKLNRYLGVTLHRLGTKKPFYVHRLVMLAFKGECPSGLEVNHKNGMKYDNRIENLEYVTGEENRKHSRNVLGNIFSGTKNSNAKLTEDEVREIRNLNKSGIGCYRLSKMYGVSKTVIQHIVKRKAWKHVD